MKASYLYDNLFFFLLIVLTGSMHNQPGEPACWELLIEAGGPEIGLRPGLTDTNWIHLAISSNFLRVWPLW